MLGVHHFWTKLYDAILCIYDYFIILVVVAIVVVVVALVCLFL